MNSEIKVGEKVRVKEHLTLDDPDNEIERLLGETWVARALDKFYQDKYDIDVDGVAFHHWELSKIVPEPRRNK